MSSFNKSVLFAAMGLLLWTQQGMANYLDDCGAAPLSNVLPNGCLYVNQTDSLLAGYMPPQPANSFVYDSLQTFTPQYGAIGGGAAGSNVLPPPNENQAGPAWKVM